MPSEPARTQDPIRLGEDFELDFGAYKLRRSGRVLKLERIPMEVLRFLVEQRGNLVTRQQIVERIWGSNVFLDTDNSINGAIRKLRRILRDDPEQPRFIQTVTGKGYRFIAPVIAPDQPLLRSTVPLSVSIPAIRTEKSTSTRWRIFAGIAVLLLVAGSVAYFRRSRSRDRAPLPGGRVLLAVLPFDNLTGDAGQDYFSDGMTEEMITQLGSLDAAHLGIIARTSVMHYKHSREPLDQIGHDLGVQYVLEGSIRRDSDRVRITAQLIELRDQTHLWARQYDRDLSHLLALQGEIAHEISDEIQIALGIDKANFRPARQSLSPQNYEAYDLYLKGQFFWTNRTVEGFRRAIGYFQQAIARDPTYARAYAGLADSYALIGGYSMAPQAEFESMARAAALRAVEIDDTLPEAHTAMALIVQNYDWNWQTAEKEFRRAIELNPNYATAHHWYAEHLMWLGRFDEALQESERARQLDPLSLIIASDNGAILYYSHQYDSAIERFRAVREMNPDFPHSGMIRMAYAQKGMFAATLAEIEKTRRMDGDGPWVGSELAYIYGRTGQQVQAKHALAKLKQWDRHQPVDPGAFVMAYIGMRDNDQAFFWLEKAYAQHSNTMITLKVDPLYDPLRSDPRFQDLLQRVGLER